MRRYFKVSDEEPILPITSYFEFEDDEPTRQVDVCGEEWVWASIEENRMAMTDQPLSQVRFLPDDEITQYEFEEIWKKAYEIGHKSSPDFITLKLDERRKKHSFLTGNP